MAGLMCVFFRPWFADADANLLALGPTVLVAFLSWEFVRDRRKRRKRKNEQAQRERSRKDHRGYV